MWVGTEKEANPTFIHTVLLLLIHGASCELTRWAVQYSKNR
jgi:hypothetical protein